MCQCWPSDRFAAARNLFEDFNKNCSKFLYPSEFLLLDETLYLMPHQISFRQYNLNKFHRYGLFVKSLNDARVPFTYKAASYSGKPKDGNGSYYSDHTENYVKYLVEEFEKDESLLGRNILTDRLYTSISLANWLLERGITTVGTLNTNRIGIPDEIKQTKDPEEFSATCHVDSSSNLYLTSHAVQTKSKGKKNVPILSTMHPLPGAARDDGCHKPAIIKLYDFNKGRTDIADQLNDYHTCQSRTFRWDVVALFYMLDTIRVNSKTIWCLKQRLDVQKFKSFDLAWELAMQLIKPFIRSWNINGLPRMRLERMERVLGEKIQVAPQTNGK